MGARQSMPAFAEGRLLVWRGHSKAQGTKLLGKLIPYLENPNPSTLLVLVLAGADKRLKVTKLAAKAGFLTEFKPLNDAEAALADAAGAGVPCPTRRTGCAPHRALGTDRARWLRRSRS